MERCNKLVATVISGTHCIITLIVLQLTRYFHARPTGSENIKLEPRYGIEPFVCLGFTHHILTDYSCAIQHYSA